MFEYENNVTSPQVGANQDLKGALTPYFYDQNGTQSSASNNGSQANLPLSCSTSTCKWEPYQTLGVCSQCADISELLTYACLPMKLDWILSSMRPRTEATWPNRKHRFYQPHHHAPGEYRLFDIAVYLNNRLGSYESSYYG
jgi:hypothetical protein